MEREAADDWTVPRQQLAARRAARTTQAEQARAALDDAFALLGAGGRARDVTLPAPGDGEVFLACFPGAVGWLAFAATDRGVTVRRVEAADFASPRTAERVLALFTPELKAARRVRLLPYGAADRVDWQAVLWRGKPLQAALEVEYGLDLGSAGPPTAPGERRPPAALVVSNPTEDLAAATAEATTVASALGGWRITRLNGAAATRGALLEALPGARLFHYAGHAQISPSDGLSSALLLGGNGRVELGDLLALPAVPELVVLPACEAAGTLEGGRSALGLAQAFIAAGARAAVAPVRPIRDTAVAAFVTAFYGAFVPLAAAPNDAVESSRRAFHSAALAAATETRNGTDASQPVDPGCEGLRLLVP
jgi:hypothetical protein